MDGKLRLYPRKYCLNMRPKTIRIFYRTIIVLFAIAMLLDGFGGITQQPQGMDVMRHLGYPMYTLIIFGVAKLLGTVAILQTKFSTIKEWAYAGFTFNFIGAFASRVFVGDSIGLLLPPVIMLAIMFLVYYLWKKVSTLQAAQVV